MCALRPLAASLLLLLLCSAAAVASAHNITAILEGFPEYSLFNSYLSQTKLADEINSRQTITVLALDNGAMADLAGKKPLSVIKNELAIHTTGNAPGNTGFVNITDLQGGKVGFGAAAPGSKLDSSYTKSVKQIPYNISVLQISAPIMVPAILAAPAPSASDANVTALLEKAGCKTFASLLVSSGVIKTYQTAMAKGLTVFAPNDESFKAKGVPDLSKLTNAELVSLLLYHAVADYTPIGSLKTSNAPISTLATNGAGKYDFSVKTAGDSVTLDTGVGSSRVASTVLDSTPVAIFTVDSVLLPTELFGKSPSPAPAPEPVTSPSPAPVSPAPGPAAKAPSPLAASPPAPPTATPGDAPAAGPAAAESADSKSDNAAGDSRAPALLAAVVAVSATVVVSSLLMS
ncbi:hypothetical protein NL676_009662 [Syzygium grande]|nr:hypothetical protein NL676_009662 [Syzygium grande]